MKIALMLLTVVACSLLLTGCNQESSRITEVHQTLTSINTLEKDGFLTSEAADSARGHYIQQLNQMGVVVGLDEAKAGKTQIGQFSSGKIMKNIIWAIASILIGLFFFYILDKGFENLGRDEKLWVKILQLIVALLVSVALVLVPNFWVATVGLVFSFYVVDSLDKLFDWVSEHYTKVITIVCGSFAVWLALSHQSVIFAWVAVAFIAVLIDDLTSVFSESFLEKMGITPKSLLRPMVIGLLIFAGGLFLHKLDAADLGVRDTTKVLLEEHPYQILRVAMIDLGVLIAMAMLLWSSRRKTINDENEAWGSWFYLPAQIIALGAISGLIWLASQYQSILFLWVAIGGFGIWLVMKPLDWIRGEAFFWRFLISGILLGAYGWVISKYLNQILAWAS